MSRKVDSRHQEADSPPLDDNTALGIRYSQTE